MAASPRKKADPLPQAPRAAGHRRRAETKQGGSRFLQRQQRAPVVDAARLSQNTDGRGVAEKLSVLPREDRREPHEGIEPVDHEA